MVETGVSYFGVRDLRHARTDLEDMAAHNCTYVVHCYTETDLRYCRDTMADVVKATHERGLKAWLDPWGVAGVFSGETFARFPLEHLDALQVKSDGQRPPAACPNHPATRRFLLEWVQAAAEAGGDAIIWDEPHFFVPFFAGEPSTAWACRCEQCRRLFEESAGHPLPEVFDEEVMAFRDRSMLGLVSELAAETRRLGMQNVLCLFPVDLASVGITGTTERLARKASGDGPRGNPLLQFGIVDWEAAAAIPGLDIFGTDPYWYALRMEPEPLLSAFTEKALDVARRNGLKTQIWVQAFSVPEGREEELRYGLLRAAELGADYLAAWSYGGTGSMSRIKCERPEVVWETIGQAYGEIRAKG